MHRFPIRTFLLAACILAALMPVHAPAINLIGIPQQPLQMSGTSITINGDGATFTTSSLATAALATTTLTVQNNQVNAVAQSVVHVQLVGGGSNSQGTPVIQQVTPGVGNFTIAVYNAHATLALNGTLKIAFVVFN